MKIWSDYYNAEGDDDDSTDCTGDCRPPSKPSYDTRTRFPLDQEHVSRLVEHHLQLANTLHLQPCDASHWLICNPTEAGKIAVIDEEAFSFLGNFRVPTTVQEIIATKDQPIACVLATVLVFLDLGFLRDLDQVPLAYSEQSGGSTLSAWLHITNACNLRCHYCYISKSSDHMEQETSQRAVDAVIRSAVRHGYERVHLKYAGGEAALQMPQVIATHDYAQQQAQEHHLRLSASLLSNGTIMTQRMIAQLKERHIHVMISLDGIGTAHDQQRPLINGAKGSFSMVDRTISRLLANDLRQPTSATSSIQIPLWVVLLFSTFCFGLTVYNKLDQASLNLRVSLLSLQYRLNMHIIRKTSKIGDMELELAEITNQLADLQTMATKTGTLLKHAKNPVQNPSRPNLTGTRERVWGVAIIAILFTILVCILSYAVYLYGGS